MTPRMLHMGDDVEIELVGGPADGTRTWIRGFVPVIRLPPAFVSSDDGLVWTSVIEYRLQQPTDRRPRIYKFVG